MGGFNAFHVTNSKQTGVLVGVLDGLKGLLVALAAWWLAPASFWTQGAAVVASIVGHVFPVWLRFKGGRGLATACGALFAIGLVYTVVWCLAWVLVYRTRHNILEANVFSIFLTPLVLTILPASALSILFVRPVSSADYLILSYILSGLLVVSHREPLREILMRRRPS